MKLEGKYLNSFMKRFVGMSTSANISVTDKGFEHYGLNSGKDVLNFTILKPLAFIGYESLNKEITLSESKIRLISDIAKQIVGNVTLDLKEDSIKLSDSKGLKKINLVADVKRVGEERKELKIEFAGSVELKIEDIKDILLFGRTIGTSFIIFNVKDKKLTINFSEFSMGAKAELNYDCNITQECASKINFYLLENIFSRVAGDVVIYLGNNLPLKIVEDNPIIRAEYVIAPMVDTNKSY